MALKYAFCLFPVGLNLKVAHIKKLFFLVSGQAVIKNNLSCVSQVNMAIGLKLKVEQTVKIHLCVLAVEEIRETKYSVRLSGCNGCRTNRRRVHFFRGEKDFAFHRKPQSISGFNLSQTLSVYLAGCNANIYPSL